MAKTPLKQNNAPTVLSFDTVSFGYGPMHPILEEASFSIKRGSKITIMGQNGAGKSTLFSLITGEYEADDGTIDRLHGHSIAIAKQLITGEEKEKTVGRCLVHLIRKCMISTQRLKQCSTL